MTSTPTFFIFESPPGGFRYTVIQCKRMEIENKSDKIKMKVSLDFRHLVTSPKMSENQATDTCDPLRQRFLHICRIYSGKELHVNSARIQEAPITNLNDKNIVVNKIYKNAKRSENVVMYRIYVFI